MCAARACPTPRQSPNQGLDELTHLLGGDGLDYSRQSVSSSSSYSLSAAAAGEEAADASCMGSLWMVRLVFFLQCASGCCVCNFLVLFFHDEGLSYKQIGIILGGIYPAANMVGQPVGCWLADHFGCHKSTWHTRAPPSLPAWDTSMPPRRTGFRRVFGGPATPKEARRKKTQRERARDKRGWVGRACTRARKDNGERSRGNCTRVLRDHGSLLTPACYPSPCHTCACSGDDALPHRGQRGAVFPEICRRVLAVCGSHGRGSIDQRLREPPDRQRGDAHARPAQRPQERLREIPRVWGAGVGRDGHRARACARQMGARRALLFLRRRLGDLRDHDGRLPGDNCRRRQSRCVHTPPAARAKGNLGPWASAPHPHPHPPRYARTHGRCRRCALLGRSGSTTSVLLVIAAAPLLQRLQKPAPQRRTNGCPRSGICGRCCPRRTPCCSSCWSWSWACAKPPSTPFSSCTCKTTSAQAGEGTRPPARLLCALWHQHLY